MTTDAIGLSSLYNYSITGLRQVLNPKLEFGAPDSAGQFLTAAKLEDIKSLMKL